MLHTIIFFFLFWIFFLFRVYFFTTFLMETLSHQYSIQSSSSSSPLQVTKAHLEVSLTSRTFMTKQEQVTKPLSSEQALDCRDVLAKVITLTRSFTPQCCRILDSDWSERVHKFSVTVALTSYYHFYSNSSLAGTCTTDSPHKH